MSTVGIPIICKAAVAFAAKEPLQIVEVTVAPPKAGEVRLKVIANALCMYYILEASNLSTR
jgi:S-(hydroxymethyl)glutathione dehydrogenase/alcohol dehydrogenase